MTCRMRGLILVIAGLLMSGCAAHTWAPGPGMSAADFEPTKARCSLMARNGGSDFFAVGSQSYVAGAAVGHAIGESVRANQNFNDCMVASGWRIFDDKAQAAQTSAAAQIKAIMAQRKECVLAVRSKPDYQPLLPHFAELDTATFTMAQLTDGNRPTPAEARILVTYIDEEAPCRGEATTALTQAVPALAPILLHVKALSEATAILLIERKLTWGEAAERNKHALEDAKTQIQQTHL